MKQLPLPDKWHLYAAQGWLGLGDHAQATEELEKIAPGLGSHPDVLELRLRIYSHANKWEACVLIADTILKLDPDRPHVWIQHSLALHELKRTQEAFDQLLPVALRFPAESDIAYNLACYCARLGRRDECEEWFKKAMTIDAETEKQADTADPELQPLCDSTSGMFRELSA